MSELLEPIREFRADDPLAGFSYSEDHNSRVYIYVPRRGVRLIPNKMQPFCRGFFRMLRRFENVHNRVVYVKIAIPAIGSIWKISDTFLTGILPGGEKIRWILTDIPMSWKEAKVPREALHAACPEIARQIDECEKFRKSTRQSRRRFQAAA